MEIIQRSVVSQNAVLRMRGQFASRVVLLAPRCVDCSEWNQQSRIFTFDNTDSVICSVPMANREELLIIRAARAGQGPAQLALGKRYLFGSASLPQSHQTALHWLEKAAEQNQQDAWILIGEHVPFAVAQQAGDPLRVAFWYERAFEGGSARAGLVLSMLVFNSWARADATLRQKSLRALKASAEAGIPDAQWLHAQQLGMREMASQPSAADLSPHARQRAEEALDWTTKAARNGVQDAQRTLADYFWTRKDYLKFLFWAVPLAQELDRRNAGNPARRRPAASHELALLGRVAQAMLATADPNTRLIERYLRMAAEGGAADAQQAYGLWIARMDTKGGRLSGVPGVAHYKKALRWLQLSAEQGSALAWYAMSRIYLKPEFSRRSVTEARRYLELAAVAGHEQAQLEIGLVAWRARRMEPGSDIRAVYWMQKAAGQGNKEAKLLLEKIAPPVRRADWAYQARESFGRELCNQYPFLSARIELGYWFGLTRAEALLIDVEAADHGHCLEVDIRGTHPRSRRRLIQILSGDQRQALDRAARMFDVVDGKSEHGPEGNYRQRLYRFRSLMSQRHAPLVHSVHSRRR
jgi:TPR repeat protein